LSTDSEEESVPENEGGEGEGEENKKEDL